MRSNSAKVKERPITKTETGIRGRIFRLQCDRLLKVFNALLKVVGHVFVIAVTTLQIELISFSVVGVTLK